MQAQNQQYEQGNGNSPVSSIQQKREGFRKEIRSSKLSQDFASRRKMFFREQMAHIINSNDHEFAKLTSWDQVREQLTSTFMPNYQGLHKFIGQNYELGIPADIEQLLTKAVQGADFLTNEHALVMLVTLTNVKKEGRAIFDSGMIKMLVDNLLKWNVVKEEDSNKYEGRVHYFETVCWVLFSLTLICDQNFEETFQTFRENITAFETHQTKLSYEQMTLFASLSIHPSFLPSEQFIRHILQLSSITHSTPPKKILEMAVYLLDNFMRYKYQNECRFESEESLDLNVMYLEFILDRLEDMAFGREQKCLLVNLLTTMVKSADERVLEQMFRSQKTQRLALMVFKKAEMDEWMGKKASLICVMEMVCQPVLLPLMHRIYSPANIAYLCYNSLFLPDLQVQAIVISSLYALCSREPSIYFREFRKYNLSTAIEKMHRVQSENGVNRDEFSLADELQMVQNEVQKWEEYGGQNVWGVRNEEMRQGYGDVEI